MKELERKRGAKRTVESETEAAREEERTAQFSEESFEVKGISGTLVADNPGNCQCNEVTCD